MNQHRTIRKKVKNESMSRIPRLLFVFRFEFRAEREGERAKRWA